MLAVLRTATNRIFTRGLAINILAQPIHRLSLADLKKEARRRGLSPSGNKATLITRIQHVEKRQDSPTSIHNHEADRGLATAATLDVKLPDLSGPDELPGPHIPFLPDFWESSSKRSADAIHHHPTSEASMPKVLVLAGSATHRASSPHDLSHGSMSEVEYETRQTRTPKTGLWGDIAADLGIPQSFDASASLTRAREAILSTAQSTSKNETSPSFKSRPLHTDETTGIWVLLGILGGSWLAGGLFSDSKKTTHSPKT